MLLQSCYRKYRAVRWKSQSVSARKVQRSFRRFISHRRILETRRLAVDLNHRLKSAHAHLRAALQELELRCQPPDDGAVSPALRALALVRGRVLDSCASRIADLVTRAVEQATPRFLSPEQVVAILTQATAGLFPDEGAEETGQTKPGFETLAPLA